MIKPLTSIMGSTNMWPYTEEENEYLSKPSEKEEWDYDTYGHGG